MSDNEAFALFTFGLIAGALLSTLVTFAIMDSSCKASIVNHGYALYCPTDGQFAFNGECSK